MALKKRSTSTIASKKRVCKKKPAPYFDQYRDLFTMKMKPVPESFIHRLAKDLIDWAMNNEDALVLRDFFFSKGIGDGVANAWARRHPVLKDAFTQAKFMIGSRREKGAIKKQYDVSMVKASMPRYDPDWKEDEIWRAELKQKQEEKTQQSNIQWVLEKFPNSPVVPEKKEDKDA